MLILLEVMDKEPSLGAIWLTYLALGISGFFAGRFRRWLVITPALLILGFAVAQLTEWLDPFVGPAIREEAGTLYLVQSTIALVVAGSLCAMGVRRRVV